MRRFAIVVALVALAGCASSGGGSKQAPPSTARSSTTTTLSAAAQALQPIVDAGLLLLTDLPAGFVATPGTGTSNTDRLLKELEPCKPFRALTDHGVTSGTSTQYAKTTQSAFDSVDVFATPEEAAAQRTLVEDPRIVDCLAARYADPFTKGHKLLPKEVKLIGADVSPLAMNAAGDGIYGFRVTTTFEITTEDTTKRESARTDVIGFQVGRALVTLQTGGDAAQLAEVETTAIPKIVERLRAAGA